MGSAKGRAAACGTATAGLHCGGEAGALFTGSAIYNGSTWTGLGNLPTARWEHGVVGTTVAALAMAGRELGNGLTTSTAFNGSTWASDASGISTGRCQQGNAGSPTSALIFGGSTDATNAGIMSSTEKYNGSSWSAGGALSATLRLLSGCGASNTAALATGGYNGSAIVATVQLYNGSAWSAGTSLTVATSNHCGGGTTVAALFFAGNGAGTVVATSYAFNGSAWTTRGNLATARQQFAGCAVAGNGALALGGYDTGSTRLDSTERCSG
jgi:hypothetical protein